MSGRLRVVIATTDGPCTIRRITEEAPELHSVVCLAGTATALAVSADYDAFVRRPTGVVERDVGHPVFRVDVDGPIDEGRSWQLGLYIAHRLKAADRLAEDDQPAEGIVWATGTVNSDLGIGPVDRVADKARRSAPLFDAGLPVLAVVAASNAEALPDRVEVLPVDRMEDVLAHLGLVAATPRATVRRRRGVTAVLGLALVLGAGGWAFWPWGGAEFPHPPEPVSEAGRDRAPPAAPLPGDPAPLDPATVAFEVVEARMEGGTCAGDAVVDPAERSAPGVCAVAFRATNSGSRPVHMWLYGAIHGTFREYVSTNRYTELAVGRLEAGMSGEVRVQPPDWIRRPILVRGLLILAPGDRPQVDRALISIDLLSAGQIDTTVAGLRDLDVEVREIFHRIVPAR